MKSTTKEISRPHAVNLGESPRFVKTHLVKEVLDVVGGEFLFGVDDAVQVRFHEIGHDIHVFELLR